MKAQFINIIKGAACLFLIQLSITASAVVPAVPAWLSPFKNLTNKNLAYNYIIQLIDGNGIMADSLKGRMYRSGNRCLDSNEINVTTHYFESLNQLFLHVVIKRGESEV